MEGPPEESGWMIRRANELEKVTRGCSRMEPKSSQMADRGSILPGQSIPWALATLKESYIMKKQEEVVQGLQGLIRDIQQDSEAIWPGRPWIADFEDEIILLADVMEIIGLEQQEIELILGQEAWAYIQEEKAPSPLWPGREILEHLDAWPAVTLSPIWSQRLEQMRLAT